MTRQLSKSRPFGFHPAHQRSTAWLLQSISTNGSAQLGIVDCRAVLLLFNKYHTCDIITRDLRVFFIPPLWLFYLGMSINAWGDCLVFPSFLYRSRRCYILNWSGSSNVRVGSDLLRSICWLVKKSFVRHFFCNKRLFLCLLDQSRMLMETRSELILSLSSNLIVLTLQSLRFKLLSNKDNLPRI